VRSYREGGKVKQEVVHLGQHGTPQSAMQVWEREVIELKATRSKQAQKLQRKMDRLRELSGEEQG
jgi:thiamine monophosphate kinase